MVLEQSDLSVVPGPQALQVHDVVGGEMLVSHTESLLQPGLAQELRPDRLRGEDLDGRAEDDVSHGDGHPADWPTSHRAKLNICLTGTFVRLKYTIDLR